MTKKEKLKARLLSYPADFTWDELKRLLLSLGYKVSNAGKTSGSRVRFTSDAFSPIVLHKPHPQPVIKKYLLRQIIEQLKKERLL